MTTNKKIIELEEELRQAMLNSDVEKLDVLIDDSLVFTIPNGVVANKSMDLQSYNSGIQQIRSLIPSEQTVTIHENTAVVTVKMELEGTFQEQDISGSYRYLRVWKCDGPQIRIIAGSAALIQN